MSERQLVDAEAAEFNRTRGGAYTFNLFPPGDWDGFIFTVIVVRLGDHAHLDVRTGRSTSRGEGVSGGEAGKLVMAWAHWLHLRGMLEHHPGVRIAEVECPTRGQLERHVAHLQREDT